MPKLNRDTTFFFYQVHNVINITPKISCGLELVPGVKNVTCHVLELLKNPLMCMMTRTTDIEQIDEKQLKNLSYVRNYFRRPCFV